MSETRKSKLCRMCYEEIDERARRCPHCLRWQTRSAAILSSGLLGWLLGTLLVVGLVALFMHTILKPFRSPDECAVYAGQIQVTESHMLFGESKEGPVVLVVGRLRNNSDVEWESVHLQAEFFDESDSLVNVETEWQYGRHIMPWGESAFKVRGPADLPRERYATYSVTVTGAEDARRWP